MDLLYILYMEQSQYLLIPIFIKMFIKAPNRLLPPIRNRNNCTRHLRDLALRFTADGYRYNSLERKSYSLQ